MLYRALPGGVTLDLALLFTLLAAWRRGFGTALCIGLWGGALVGTAMGVFASLAWIMLWPLSGPVGDACRFSQA